MGKPTNWAQSLFDEKEHDFGPVAHGAIVRHPFKLTNRLGHFVTILDVRASCGCTSGKANVTTLQPGEQGVVTAQMDTRNFVGHKATVLFVTLADATGRQGEARLGVSSDILSDIVLNPGFVNFGTVAASDSPEHTISIERLGNPQWRALRMLTSSKVLKGNLVETARSATGVTYALTVGLKPGSRAGFIDDEIIIVTNDPESPRIPIRIAGQVRGDLSVSPATAALGKLKPTRKAEAKFLLKSSQPFSIVETLGADAGFEIKAAAGPPAKLRQVTVVFDPSKSRLRGDIQRSFSVRTDLPGEEPAVVTVSLHIDP